MAANPTGPGGRVALASLTGILALVDGGFAAIGLLVFNAHRTGHLSTAEAATFTLLGAGAAVGAIIMLLALIAFARGTRGHGIARITAGMAWLRLAAVIIALVAIAAAFGTTAIVGAFQTFGAAVAVADAILALIVTGIAVRRTRHG
jgi:hypothetical protein